MATEPEIMGALISEKLGALGTSSTSEGVEELKRFIRAHSAAAQQIWSDELGGAAVETTQVATQDRVAAIYRYLRASWEGVARLNLRLIAKVIVGGLKSNALDADEFLPHADALAALSRDEVTLLAVMLRCYAVPQRSNFNRWKDTEAELRQQGWTEAKILATAGRALRSGYVVPTAHGLGNMVVKVEFHFEPSPLLLDLCRTVDFEDALRREAKEARQ